MKANKYSKSTFPAITLIEFSSIAAGIAAGDAMVKKAPLDLVKAGTAHSGKYLVLVGGQVAAVEESYSEGMKVGREYLIDDVILPDIHADVLKAILGHKIANKYESLGVIETSTVAANIKAADAAVKGTDVDILEIRLADGIGGHGLTFFGGKVEDIQAAIEIGISRIKEKEKLINKIVIPRIDSLMGEQLDTASRFFGGSE